MPESTLWNPDISYADIQSVLQDPFRDLPPKISSGPEPLPRGPEQFPPGSNCSDDFEEPRTQRTFDWQESCILEPSRGEPMPSEMPEFSLPCLTSGADLQSEVSSLPEVSFEGNDVILDFRSFHDALADAEEAIADTEETLEKDELTRQNKLSRELDNAEVDCKRAETAVGNCEMELAYDVVMHDKDKVPDVVVHARSVVNGRSRNCVTVMKPRTTDATDGVQTKKSGGVTAKTDKNVDNSTDHLVSSNARKSAGGNQRVSRL